MIPHRQVERGERKGFQGAAGLSFQDVDAIFAYRILLPPEAIAVGCVKQKPREAGAFLRQR
jgi:hypothetical protein